MKFPFFGKKKINREYRYVEETDSENEISVEGTLIVTSIEEPDINVNDYWFNVED